MNTHIEEITEEVEKAGQSIKNLISEIDKEIVGQRYLVERLILGLLADGHVLVEGVPGLAKTTAVKTLAKAIKTKFKRIQFTPDLLPADLIGTEVYSPKSGEFSIKKGPLFANIVLADEINRAPAKVQSALLEAMQEKQITIGNETFPLEEPFLVMATQNPIEQEGTYSLPEAQIDRFMLKLNVTYPSKSEEKIIMNRRATNSTQKICPVITPEEVIKLREVVNKVYMDEKIQDYIVDLVFATRDPKVYKLDKLTSLIEHGASPRASIYLNRAAKGYAFLKGRGFVTPQDVKTIGIDVLRHRIILSYQAEAENITTDDVILKIFDQVEVP